jgi:hypothetical protein
MDEGRKVNWHDLDGRPLPFCGEDAASSLIRCLVPSGISYSVIESRLEWTLDPDVHKNLMRTGAGSIHLGFCNASNCDYQSTKIAAVH